MIRSILWLLCLFLGFQLVAQNIEFVDQNLKTYLLTENSVDIDGDGTFETIADLNLDGEIQISEALSIERLRLLQSISSEIPIHTISEINYFQNLIRLDVINLTELERLEALGISGLEYLWIGGCYNIQAIDISDLPNIIHLRIEDHDGIPYINLQNGSLATEYFSLFYTINTLAACVDDIQEEYDEAYYMMAPGTIPEMNCALGVSEFNSIHVTLSPNPAKDDISIISEGKIDILKIFSISGQLIMKKIEPSEKVDVSSLKSGIYFLQFYSENRIGFKKMIKE